MTPKPLLVNLTWAALLVALMYVLSTGPVLSLIMRGYIPQGPILDAITLAYAPLKWLYDHFTPCQKAFDAYFRQWGLWETE
jgi:hypothetical protein